MLSKSLEKYINSLRTKKQRHLEKRFVIEGEKMIEELILQPELILHLVCYESWVQENRSKLIGLERKITMCNEIEMGKITSLQNQSPVLAVAAFRTHANIRYQSLSLLLDGIQDPGNLGTIIRSADWFGLDAVYISPDSVDMYNPKVVQASMGSLLRVPVIETDLIALINKHKKIPVFGADMNGTYINKIEKVVPAFILIGNEGSGLKKEMEPYVNETICIPRKGKAESLNAAVAASIICALWEK